MRKVLIALSVCAALIAAAPACAEKKKSVSAAKELEAQAHYDTALAYVSSEKGSQALEELERAAAINPYDPNIYNVMGLVYFHKERFEKARESYAKAIELDPKHGDARHNMGALLLYMGQYDQAISEFNEALANDVYRNQANSLNALGWAYYKKQDYVRAEQYFKEVIERDRLYFIAYDNLAKVYIASGRIDEAMVELGRVLEQAPLYPEANLDMGICYLKKQDQAKAREHFLKVVQIDPLGTLGQQAQEYLNLLDVGGSNAGRTTPTEP